MLTRIHFIGNPAELSKGPSWPDISTQGCKDIKGTTN